jgi:S1-C subfamily serine protease
MEQHRMGWHIWVASAALAVAGACSNGRDPATAVYRISDEMCGTLMVGTAVAIDEGRLVTNAHNVVGGDGVVSVLGPDGQKSDAQVTEIDTDRDLALLITELDVSPIERGQPVEGSSGTIMRLGEDGTIELVEFSDADVITARGHDIYDAPSDVGRATVRVIANVQPGWSGAPVIDAQDRMVGLVWAESRRTGYTYAVAAEEVDRFTDSASTEPVTDTLTCAP